MIGWFEASVADGCDKCNARTRAGERVFYEEHWVDPIDGATPGRLKLTVRCARCKRVR